MKWSLNKFLSLSCKRKLLKSNFSVLFAATVLQVPKNHVNSSEVSKKAQESKLFALSIMRKYKYGILKSNSNPHITLLMRLPPLPTPYHITYRTTFKEIYAHCRCTL